MSRKGKSLKSQVYDVYRSMLVPGESKFLAKKDGSITHKIFSYRTYHAYMAVGKRFAEYCKQTHHCKTLEECRKYTQEWIQLPKENGEQRSPYSQKAYACALAKLFHCSMREISNTIPERSRKNIRNSRSEVRHYDPEGKHRDVIRFVRATGLRCSELKNLRSGDFKYADGVLYVHVCNGKGGKERYATVIQDTKWVESIMRRNEGGKVFPCVPDRLHRYRAEYATHYYESLARKDIPPADRYYCRKELKGTVYDRRAMRIVSHSLGHERIKVIASHYLRSSR